MTFEQNDGNQSLMLLYWSHSFLQQVQVWARPCRLQVLLRTKLTLGCQFRGREVLFRRRQWHPTPVLLPVKSHGRRSLVGCSPWSREESDTTERLHFHFSLFTFHFHALEKGMATHSRVLAWRIPGTGEPGGLTSMGLHRVRHD